MKVFINGIEHEYAHVKTLADLIAQITPVQPFALAVNGQFVAKHNTAQWTLSCGDKIEVLSPIQGG